MGLHKILKIVGLILSLAGVIFLAMIIMKGDIAIKDALINGENVASIDWFIYVAYIIFALVLLSVVIFGFKGLLSGNIKNTLIILGAFIVIIAISYTLADNTPMVLNDGKMLSESGSKWIGAGLYTFYLLGTIAIVSMIVSGFKRAK